MRRMWAAGAVALACLALGGTTVGVAAATPLGVAAATPLEVAATTPLEVAATPLDFNISIDSGAEAARGGTGGKVAIPGWKTSSLMTAVRYGAPGFPTRAQARRVFGETNVFYCGGATERSTARQKIALSGRNSQIDAGNFAVDLSVRIGSTNNDGDAGVMIIQFLNGGGALIGTFQTDTVVTNSGLLPRIKAVGGVPPGTRSLQVILQGTAAAGTGCDVLFDNVSVRLVPR